MIAQQALFRVQLVTEEPGLVQLAERALEATRLIAEATDRLSLEDSVEQAKQALNDFVLGASECIRT
jgi:hypothetical protein